MKKLSSFNWVLMGILTLVMFSCDEEPEVVHPKPVAAFTFAADETNPLVVDFTNASQNHESVSWNFGDGSAASTVASPTHTFAEAGDYTVVLTVTGKGGTDTESKVVTVEAPVVQPAAPVAGFTFAVDETDPLMVAFTNTSTGQSTVSWNFGDNSAASTEVSPTHTYAAAGDYTVVLTVTGEGGTDEISQVVTVTSSDTEVPTEPAEPVTLIDFESGDTAFEAWGGNTFEVVDNPHQTGINTSATVGKVVHGTSDGEAGVWTALANPLDFSDHKALSVKLYAPVTGKFMFKIEHPTNNQIKIEQWFDVTVANEWVEFVWDLSGVENLEAETYQKLVLYPGIQTTTAETYYFDDIKLIPAAQ